MLVGINAPSLINQRLADKRRLLRDRLVELDMRSVRVPLIWSELDPAGEGRLNSSASERIDLALSALPPDANLLGVLLHPSSSVAEDYFHDVSTLAERFSQFAAAVAKRFPEINEWEVWNEPNASDFYLSVRDGNTARPWSPDEFVEHVLLPGARSIRQVQPKARLCIAGMAEDGVVGHTERPPALSNRMPHKADYDRYRVPGPHGQFFFVPNFWDGLCRAIDCQRDELVQLFDACGFHPYPYFAIQKRPDKGLLQATIGHSKAFLERYNASGLSDLEIWVTEFGARSLLVAGQHCDDQVQQLEYAEAALLWMAESTSISRAYWYKLIDLPWDLQQEKTFGLLDHRLMPRQAFHAVRSIAHRQHTGLPRTALVETFQSGRQSYGPGLDADNWQVSSDTIFGYTIGTATDEGNGECLIVPGRAAGNHVRIESMTPLSLPKDQAVSLRVDASLSFESGPADLGIVLAGDGSNELSVVLSLNGRCEIAVAQDGAVRHVASPDCDSWPVATAKTINRVDLLWSAEGLNVELCFDQIRLHRSFIVAAPPGSASLTLALTITRTGGRPVFLSLSRIEARTVPPLPLIARPPQNRSGEEDWFLALPRHSQIFQDDWVIQMLRFKRGGFFAEIGGHDGVENSNTLLLERLLGWKGMIVEANPRWHREICFNRTATAYNNAAFSRSGQTLEFVDAGAVGGIIDFLQSDIHAGKRQKAIHDGRVIRVEGRRTDELLASAAAPRLVDYLSVDTEGSEAEVLSGIDLHSWQVALITVEHGGVEEKRREVWDILKPHGFLRHRVWFEDWFWHPKHLAVALSTDETEARAHAERVFRRERHHRRSRLMAEAKRLKEAGKLASAADLWEETGKAFHPDNVHGLAEAIESRAQLGQTQRALSICDAALDAFPLNRRILRQCALRYAEAGRWGKLANVMARITTHTPDLLRDERLAPLAEMSFPS